MALKHIRCGSPNEGEMLVIHYLMNELQDTYGFLLSNYHHPHYSGTREHDIILINERGVWCLEVKDWHGPIKAGRIWWVRSDKYRIHNPLTALEKKVKHISTTLMYTGFGNTSVVGMVVLAQSEQDAPLEINVNDPLAFKVFRRTSRLIHAVTGWKFQAYPDNQNKKLTAEHMKRIVDILLPQVDDSEPEAIFGYTLHDLEEGELYRTYKGKHNFIPGQYARIKKYDMPAINSPQEFQRAARRFQQDMLALRQVKNHPNIVQVYDYLPDPQSHETYWLILEWVEGVTLSELLDYGFELEMPIPFDEQLRIVRSLTDALEYCHMKGIIHRNINPSSIYFAIDGTVKLGDFDYARVPDPNSNRTISKIGEPLIVNRYTAPELQKSGRDANVQSDLYAMGALWYDMALRPAANENIAIARLDGAALPAKAIELLRQLLDPQPSNRPASAQEVRTLLAQL